MPDLPEFRRKLDDARYNVRHLTVIGMRPNLTPGQRAIIAERTERALARLRKIALDQKRELDRRLDLEGHSKGGPRRGPLHSALRSIARPFML
jgi:hypothetical protein